MDYKNISQFQKVSFGFLLIILILAVTALTGVVLSNQIKAGRYIGQEAANSHQITVSGIGKKYVKPDLALINFSVVTDKATVSEAMEENTQKMNEVIKSLENLKVTSKDIQTTNFDLHPRYEWRDKDKIFPSGRRVLVGYEVNQTLQVKVRDLSKVGAVIDQASQAGANQIGSFQLTFDHPEELEAQVRLQAIRRARQNAQSLANQLGVHLGKVINVSFGGTIPQPLRMSGVLYKAEAGESPQIQTGQNLIQVTAHITYQID